MYQIDNPSASPSQPASSAPGTPGYFTDGVPGNSIPATVFPAEWANAVMLELLNVLKAAGMNPSKAAFNQLASAIQSGGINYAADTGAANAYAVAMVNVPPSLLDGMRVRFSASNANTGASTLNVNGLGVKPIWGLNAQPLQGGEILAASRVEVQWNSAAGAWVLLNASGGAMQLGAGSYGVTAPQFDAGAGLATDAFVQRALGNFSAAGFLNASTVLTAASAGQLIVLGGSGTLTATLPPLASVQRGTAFSFMSGTGAAWTLACSGADKFAPNSFTFASFVINAGDCVTVVSDGSFWRPMSGSSQLQYSASFGSSLAVNGYQKLPTGFLAQWGAASITGGSVALTFPVAYPNGVLGIFLQPSTTGSYSTNILASGWSKTGFTAQTFASNTAVATGVGSWWYAIGY